MCFLCQLRRFNSLGASVYIRRIYLHCNGDYCSRTSTGDKTKVLVKPCTLTCSAEQDNGTKFESHALTNHRPSHTFLYKNCSSIHTQPVNPLTETTSFWNCSSELSRPLSTRIWVTKYEVFKMSEFINTLRVHTVLKSPWILGGSPWKVLEFHFSLKSPEISVQVLEKSLNFL